MLTLRMIISTKCPHTVLQLVPYLVDLKHTFLPTKLLHEDVITEFKSFHGPHPIYNMVVQP